MQISFSQFLVASFVTMNLLGFTIALELYTLADMGVLGGGVLVLALLGSAGASIVSPTIGPLARRGFVAPSTPVVPDRAFPVALAELPEETNTFWKSSEPGSVSPDPDVHRPPFAA